VEQKYWAKPPSRPAQSLVNSCQLSVEGWRMGGRFEWASTL